MAKVVVERGNRVSGEWIILVGFYLASVTSPLCVQAKWNAHEEFLL